LAAVRGCASFELAAFGRVELVLGHVSAPSASPLRRSGGIEGPHGRSRSRGATSRIIATERYLLIRHS